MYILILPLHISNAVYHFGNQPYRLPLLQALMPYYNYSVANSHQQPVCDTLTFLRPLHFALHKSSLHCARFARFLQAGYVCAHNTHTDKTTASSPLAAATTIESSATSSQPMCHQTDSRRGRLYHLAALLCTIMPYLLRTVHQQPPFHPAHFWGRIYCLAVSSFVTAG